MTNFANHAMAAIAACAMLIGHAPAIAGSVTEHADLKPLFDAAGTTGTLVVLDVTRDRTMVYNPSRAATPYLPASTFKILNSLIALESGAVKDVDSDAIPWNGKAYTVNGQAVLPAACNAATVLRVAFRNSCVPAYQEIARRVGAARYREYLRAADYGNRDPGGPVDWFWLNGDLRISAHQQIDFLKQLTRQTLPFSAATHAQVKDIMLVEQTQTYAIRAKTGYADHPGVAVGWWVGWVERGADVYLFALNLDLLKPQHGKARMEITKAALNRLGIL